jgi:hypothetical protein
MLNQPPLTANNAGAWAIPNAPTDTDAKYVVANPPTTRIINKWYEILDIGTETRTGSNQVSYASPLAINAIQRIHTDTPPDFWIIAVRVGAANTELDIWTDADPVGYPVRLGNGGNCCLPSRGRPFLTLQARTGAVIGTVIALAGFSASEVFIFGGNQT